MERSSLSPGWHDEEDNCGGHESEGCGGGRQE